MAQVVAIIGEVYCVRLSVVLHQYRCDFVEFEASLPALPVAHELGFGSFSRIACHTWNEDQLLFVLVPVHIHVVLHINVTVISRRFVFKRNSLANTDPELAEVPNFTFRASELRIPPHSQHQLLQYPKLSAIFASRASPCRHQPRAAHFLPPRYYDPRAPLRGKYSFELLLEFRSSASTFAPRSPEVLTKRRISAASTPRFVSSTACFCRPHVHRTHFPKRT